MASLALYSNLWSTPPKGSSSWKLDDIGAQGMHPHVLVPINRESNNKGESTIS